MNIISTYRELGTYRGAADLCGTTHKTVKRVVERAEAGGAPQRLARPRNFDQVRDLVAERVAKSAGRISAKRLLPFARAAGYEGSPRNFRRLVAEQKALWRKDHHRGRRPAVWSPGQYLVIDWAEAAPGLFLFCAALAFSRWRFVRFAADQKATTTLAMIAEALAAIGGVPAKVLASTFYQGGFIELPGMKRRATEVSSRRKELQHKRTSLAQERTELARDNQLRRRVHDFAARIHTVIDSLDDTQKQQLLRLLVEDVRVTGWHVQIRLRIALDPPPPHPTGPTAPTGKPSPPRPVSSQDALRSVGGIRGGLVENPIAAGRIG